MAYTDPKVIAHRDQVQKIIDQVDDVQGLTEIEPNDLIDIRTSLVTLRDEPALLEV